MISASFFAVLGLAVVHLLAGKLRFLHVIPRSRFLSIAGGMSVAYVFLRILPDLSRTELRVGYEVEEALKIPQSPIYVVALLGLVVFYGLQRLADQSRKKERSKGGDDCPSPTVFWLSMASYSIVNFGVGYLMPQRADTGLQRLLLFFGAMALWFVVNDYGLREQYREQYRRVGRWVLTGAIFIGWLTGMLAPVPDLVLSLALAFVGGGVIMNVLKEELPAERESRFWAFALGAGAYAALLLAV
jgi:hypothetical protein